MKRKTKNPKFKGVGVGMEKLFTTKAKRSSKALPLKGSTWLKTPSPKREKPPLPRSSRRAGT